MTIYFAFKWRSAIGANTPARGGCYSIPLCLRVESGRDLVDAIRVEVFSTKTGRDRSGLEAISLRSLQAAGFVKNPDFWPVG